MTDPDIIDSRETRSFRREALALTVAIWTVHYFILTSRDFALGMPELLQSATLRIGWTVMGILICAVVYFILERFRDSRFTIQLLIAGLMGFPAAYLHVVGTYYTRIIAVPETASEGSMLSMINEWVSLGTYWLWVYFGWSACILALRYSLRVRREQRLRAEAQALAHQAQMRALRYQLNPHFLFNTLNSVAALVLDGNARLAELMLRKLSGFLRQGLQGDPLDDIALDQEVEHQKLYLDIEQLRFPDRLSVDVDIPDELQGALVPSFILQPIVENAVKYAVAPNTDRTTIRIEAREADGMLKLSVTDDGKANGKNQPGTGIGLDNVRQRLASRFGDRFDFSGGPQRPHGYRVDLAMPLRRAAA
jgi:glucose-6-phosphate-specific signal transduction histidine kinase